MSKVGSLQYFTHPVDGRLYGGWYRQAGTSVEVYARGRVRTAPVGDRPAEQVAQTVLAAIVRRARRGELREQA